MEVDPDKVLCYAGTRDPINFRNLKVVKALCIGWAVAIGRFKRCGHASMPKWPHACPFQSEINYDETPRCQCCADCQHECVMEI